MQRAFTSLYFSLFLFCLPISVAAEGIWPGHKISFFSPILLLDLPGTSLNYLEKDGFQRPPS